MGMRNRHLLPSLVINPDRALMEFKHAYADVTQCAEAQKSSLQKWKCREKSSFSSSSLREVPCPFYFLGKEKKRKRKGTSLFPSFFCNDFPNKMITSKKCSMLVPRHRSRSLRLDVIFNNFGESPSCLTSKGVNDGLHPSSSSSFSFLLPPPQRNKQGEESAEEILAFEARWEAPETSISRKNSGKEKKIWKTGLWG